MRALGGWLPLARYVVDGPSMEPSFRAGERLQAFTAIGRVAGDAPYQTKVTAQFIPWRRRMEFVECEEAMILPLVPGLAFIADKTNWGLSLKRGLFEINAEDFSVIAKAMKADLG